jgi:hypothetical protein
MNKINECAARASMAHQKYLNRKGIPLPSVSKIVGVMDKPGLVKWANNLGLQGIDSNKYVDVLAGSGTLAHSGILCDLMNTMWNTSSFSGDQIKMAKASMRKWYKWLDKQKFKMILAEKDFISEKHQFGGRFDIYGMLNRKRTLIDIKTCKSLWDNHSTQTAGYKILLEENGYKVDEMRLIRLPRNDEEGMEPEDLLITDVDLHTERFLCCRKLFDLNAKISMKYSKH